MLYWGGVSLPLLNCFMWTIHPYPSGIFHRHPVPVTQTLKDIYGEIKSAYQQENTIEHITFVNNLECTAGVLNTVKICHSGTELI